MIVWSGDCIGFFVQGMVLDHYSDGPDVPLAPLGPERGLDGLDGLELLLERFPPLFLALASGRGEVLDLLVKLLDFLIEGFFFGPSSPPSSSPTGAGGNRRCC